MENIIKTISLLDKKFINEKLYVKLADVKNILSDTDTKGLESDRTNIILIDEQQYINLGSYINFLQADNEIFREEYEKLRQKITLEYFHKGIIINQYKKEQHNEEFQQEIKSTLELIRSNINLNLFDGKESSLVTIIEDYMHSWMTFSSYDKSDIQIQNLHLDSHFQLDLNTAFWIVENFRQNLIDRNQADDIFGKIVNDKLDGIIGAVNQSIDGNQVYSSIEEKAANLLYLIIKDHPFVDGNKRIASIIFLYYLKRNNFEFKINNEKKLNDNAIVALTLLVASSDPKDKQIMINLIIKLIQNDYTLSELS